jgi:hypothetical protein
MPVTPYLERCLAETELSGASDIEVRCVRLVRLQRIVEESFSINDTSTRDSNVLKLRYESLRSTKSNQETSICKSEHRCDFCRSLIRTKTKTCSSNL